MAGDIRCVRAPGPCLPRSEEHTSELQSHHELVCRLLLEKKKPMVQPSPPPTTTTPAPDGPRPSSEHTPPPLVRELSELNLSGQNHDDNARFSSPDDPDSL